ncbi:helix-turn-helix domain-containing protein [Leucobacter sp. GX0328]
MNRDITKQDFGRFVTEHRRAAGFTQRQLAERLHVTESAVSKWERGLSYPDITVRLVLGWSGTGWQGRRWPFPDDCGSLHHWPSGCPA